jgi:hypothetical protein
MNIQDLAKKIAFTQKSVKAYKYDLYYRDFDNVVELLALVDDPNYNMKDFEGREMLFPKKWVTLTLLDPDMEVKV